MRNIWMGFVDNIAPIDPENNIMPFAVAQNSLGNQTVTDLRAVVRQEPIPKPNSARPITSIK